jgi:4-carboxymuconolactone decarboxylase
MWFYLIILCDDNTGFKKQTHWRDIIVNDYEKGVEALSSLVGADKANKIIKRFNDLSPSFENEAISVVFGRTWSREAIDARARSLCSIGILAALGRNSALKIVFGIALRNGVSVEEITEALLQVAIYAGYPAALDALPILQEVINEEVHDH